MSGLSGSIPPRACPAPDRPPVDSCTIMPGQCASIPSFSRAKRSGSEVGVPSSIRTWQWAMLAPASKAAWVDSTCSATVIGTAGLSDFCGTEPVIATQMMQGLDMTRLPGGRAKVYSMAPPVQAGDQRPRSSNTALAALKHSNPCGTPQ